MYKSFKRKCYETIDINDLLCEFMFMLGIHVMMTTFSHLCVMLIRVVMKPFSMTLICRRQFSSYTL